MTRRNIRRAKLLTLAVCFAVRSNTFGDIVTWINPLSGNWTDGTKWSSNPSFPNTASTDVVIDALGAPYTVTVNQLITASSVTLNAPGVTLLNVENLSTPLLNIEVGSVTIGSSLSNTRLQGAGFIQTSNFSALSNVTLAATLNVTGTFLNINGNFTLDGGTLSLDGNVSSSIDHAQTFDGTGTIVFHGGDAFVAFQGLTIGSGVTVTTGASDGSLRATSGGTITNFGTLIATAGRTLAILDGPFKNFGTIHINNGTFVLGANQSLADLGTVIRTGGDFRITGTFTVPSGALDLDTHLGGSLTLDKGALVTSAITASGRSTLIIASAGGTIGGSTPATPWTLSADIFDQAVSGCQGLTFTSSVLLDHRTVLVSNDSLIFVAAGDLLGTGSFVFKGPGNGATGIETTGAAPLVVGPGVVIRTDSASSGAFFRISAVQFTNQGLLSSEAPNSQFAINCSQWQNQAIHREIFPPEALYWAEIFDRRI